MCWWVDVFGCSAVTEGQRYNHFIIIGVKLDNYKIMKFWQKKEPKTVANPSSFKNTYSLAERV